MRTRKLRWLALMVLFLHVTVGPARAEETVIFGLTNKAINGAALSYDAEFRDLRVEGLSKLGYKGLSVRLGQADSGLFFSPYTHSTPIEDGNFMAGHAFGRIGGIDRRISSVYCERAGWATYPVFVDFLPLGTVSKTVQIFVDQIYVGEETYTNGAVTISTSNSDSIGPRVNPFWRMPDGSVGVLLEFTDTPPVTLPSGRSTYASHIFIRANNPLFTVDHVSRVDIYGGGGLTEFSSIDERLGMFGRAHRALGGAVFSAKKSQLTIANCADAGTDGVLIELNNSPEFSIRFKPVSLASTGALFHVSAAGSYHRTYGHLGSSYFGVLGVENIEGEKRLRVDTAEAHVEVFDGTNLIGAYFTTNSGHIGSFGTNDLDIISAGVTGGMDVPSASLHFQFREPVTLSHEQHWLRGNFLRVSTVRLTNDIDTFGSFHVLACGVRPFTITNEAAASPPPINLAIERAGTNISVSWPRFISYPYFETASAVTPGAAWSQTYGRNLPYTLSRGVTLFPRDLANSRYFRLYNPFAQISEPFLTD